MMRQYTQLLHSQTTSWHYGWFLTDCLPGSVAQSSLIVRPKGSLPTLAMYLACKEVRRICFETVALAVGEPRADTLKDGHAKALASVLYNMSPAHEVVGSESDKRLKHAEYLKGALPNALLFTFHKLDEEGIDDKSLEKMLYVFKTINTWNKAEVARLLVPVSSEPSSSRRLKHVLAFS